MWGRGLWAPPLILLKSAPISPLPVPVPDGKARRVKITSAILRPLKIKTQRGKKQQQRDKSKY